MKIMQIKSVMLCSLIGIASIPAFSLASMASPIVGGSDSTGADVNSSIVNPPIVTVGGGSTTGADSNTSLTVAPTDIVVGGGSTTGADSNTSSVQAPANVVVGGGSTTGADSNTSSVTPPANVVVGGGNTTGADATVPTQPVVNGGGSSSSSSGGRAIFLAAPFVAPVSTATSCNYLTGYMRLGGKNDSSEVTKLQAFLKNVENINVDTNGIFDTKTFEGVKAFQAKYLTETMGPWGTKTPSGQVFFTTKKKINELYCKSEFALTAAQIAQINAYKNNIAQANTPAVVGENAGTNTTDLNINATGTNLLSPEVGSAVDNNAQTASAANTSFGGKIWNFFKWLFGAGK